MESSEFPSFLTCEDRQHFGRNRDPGAYDWASLTSGSDVSKIITGPGTWTNTDDVTVCAHTSRGYNSSWPQDRSQSHNQLTIYHGGHTQPYQLLHNTGLHTAFGAHPGEDQLKIILQALCVSIPPSVNAAQIMNEEHFSRVVHEYQLQRSSYLFRFPPLPSHAHLITQLKKSKTVVWAMDLAGKLFKSLGENPHGTMTLRCIDWINKLEQNIDSSFYNNPPQSNATGRLLTQLEITFLKFVAISSVSGYGVLRKALPGFLSMIAADPNFYTEHPNGNLVVSFAHTFCTPRYEIKRFVMYDIATSLVLGVRPLVEYGYDVECDPVSHGLEWIHGVPVVLAEAVSQVNSWRAGSRTAPLDDWRNLERRVLAWQPRPFVVETEESTMENMGRSAVQEGWRYVTLIYIYMGMCGVSSHDPRVQMSITQIVQLGETVADLRIGVHMFVHFLVVGIGAQYEQHRSIVRMKLASFIGSHVWLFRGPEFAQILEHMWHSVGADGAPVTWDDYIRSRRVVAPL